MITGMHHAAIRTGEFDKAVKFYTEGLGLKPCFEAGADNGRMVLFPVGDSFIEIFADGKAKPHGAIEHIALTSTDVDLDFQRAIAAGATETIAPKDVLISNANDQKLDLRIAFVTSPTGEMIEFFKHRN